MVDNATVIGGTGSYAHSRWPHRSTEGDRPLEDVWFCAKIYADMHRLMYRIMRTTENKRGTRERAEEHRPLASKGYAGVVVETSTRISSKLSLFELRQRQRLV